MSATPATNRSPAARKPARDPASLERLAAVLRFLLLAAVVGPGAILAAFATVTYQHAVRDAEALVATSLHVLEEHTAKVLETHELILDRLGALAGGADLSAPAALAAITQGLQQTTRQHPQVSAAWVTDATGEVHASSLPLPAQGVNARGRDYFEEQRQGDQQTYVGVPQAGRISTQRIFVLSRRLPSASSQFTGVVASGVKTSEFEQFFERLGSASHAAALIRSDGAVLARVPGDYSRPQLASITMAKLQASAAVQGSFWAQSDVDGVDRLWGGRKLAGYPVLVSFGLDKTAIFAGWWHALGLSAAAALLVMLTLMSAIMVALKRTHREREAHEKLLAEIAERSRIEATLQQAQKMEAIGQLTGGLSHDFNNLLGIVIGNLDFLKEQPNLAPAATEALDEALEAALRGADLNRRLLAFARRQPLQPKPVDINDLVISTAKLLGRTLGEHIELRVSTASNLGRARVDPAQLEAAITNLAVNARDAMPAGGQLTITTYNKRLDADYAAENPEVEPGEYVAIEVTDTGTGIAPEILVRVFEPFFTTKVVGKGTGLGLSMIFGFVKQSGGHVKIYSEVGTGTTVRVYLPRLADEATTAGEAVAAPALPRAEGQEVVLVVEDNPALRRVLVRQLRELGYETLEAEAGPAALVLLQTEQKIDLLLSDIVMPGGLSGFDLAREAAKLRPRLKVLFTSGFPQAALDREVPFTAGESLLSKPYRKDELAQKVRQMLTA